VKPLTRESTAQLARDLSATVKTYGHFIDGKLCAGCRWPERSCGSAVAPTSTSLLTPLVLLPISDTFVLLSSYSLRRRCRFAAHFHSSDGNTCVSPGSSSISKTVSSAAVLAYIPAREMRSIRRGTPSSETAAS